MREIKFRVWYKGEPFPIDEDDLMEYEKPQMIYDVQKLYDGMGVNSQVLLGYGSFGGLLEDEEFEIMQFTGLKDKNGKDIYEGDILEWDEREWGSPFTEEVKWDYELFSSRKNDWKQFCEVIGNIYENKELLNTME